MACLMWAVFCTNGLSAATLERVGVLGVSSSGKSVILNSGHLEGLVVGDYAQILRLAGPAHRPKLKSIGLAELVRATPRESYWFMHEQNRANSVTTGDKVSLLRQSQSLKGLRGQRVLQKKVVLSSGQRIEDDLIERMLGTPESLISDNSNQFDSRALELEKPNDDAFDIEVSQYDVWSQKNSPDFLEEKLKEFEVEYVSQLNEVSDANRIRHDDRREVFRSYVKNIIRAINSQKDGLNELYQRDMDKQYKTYVGDILVKRSLYNQVTEPEDERLKIKPHIAAKVKRDGPLWSSSFDDQELRNVMVKSGLAEELRRKEKAKGQSQAHEVIIRASTGLAKHTNVDDPNFQNVNYSVSASYEYALKKASDMLAAWTIEAEIYTAINFYEIAPETNGRFNEGGFGGAINYYFYNNPFTVGNVAFYGGLGLRRSSATGGTSVLEGQDTFDYQVLSLPVFQLGAKYRFKAGDSYRDNFKVGMGFNVLLSYESKNLSIIDENDLQSPVFSSFDIQDTRLAVGLSLYF